MQRLCLVTLPLGLFGYATNNANEHPYATSWQYKQVNFGLKPLEVQNIALNQGMDGSSFHQRYSTEEVGQDSSYAQ